MTDLKAQRARLIELYETLVDNTPEFIDALDDLAAAYWEASYQMRWRPTELHIAELIGEVAPF